VVQPPLANTCVPSMHGVVVVEVEPKPRLQLQGEGQSARQTRRSGRRCSLLLEAKNKTTQSLEIETGKTSHSYSITSSTAVSNATIMPRTQTHRVILVMCTSMSKAAWFCPVLGSPHSLPSAAVIQPGLRPFFDE
jgi:hypothetical protein